MKRHPRRHRLMAAIGLLLLPALGSRTLTATPLAAPTQAPAQAPAALGEEHALELVVLLGQDPRLILAATLAATRPEGPALPLLIVEPVPTRLEMAAAFIARLSPRRSLILAPRSLRAAQARTLVATLGLPRSALRRGSPAALGRVLLEASRTSSTKEEAPLYLVGEDDLEAALLATVAAGRRGGFLAFVGSGEDPAAIARGYSAGKGPPLRPELVGRLARRFSGPAQAEAHTTIVRWPDPSALGRIGLDDPRSQGERRLVVANLADTRGHFSPPRLSLLAPYVALEQGAELRLVDDAPETLEALAHAAPPLDTLTLVGDAIALGQRTIDDPDDLHRGVVPPRRFSLPGLIGLDRLEAAEIAVGRLAALDVHELSLQLARQQASRLGRWPRSRRALMLANVDHKFQLGEAIARATVQELEFGGFAVEAKYGEAVEEARRAGRLPGHQLIIWEGHPRDLGIDGHLGLRRELLDARLVVLQGCYTLERNDASALTALGAESILGTTMPVYSASGSALAKVFLDAQLYHGATTGEALVHARNFTLAFLRLKKKRGLDGWRRTWRAGLAFELWGDPTARPLGPAVSQKQEGVRLVREGKTLRFVLPEGLHPQVRTEGYTATIHPGGQLGSLLWRESDESARPRRVQELYFGQVALPDQTRPPRLRSDLPEESWAMVWAPTHRLLYLLVRAAAQPAPNEGSGATFVLEP